MGGQHSADVTGACFPAVGTLICCKFPHDRPQPGQPTVYSFRPEPTGKPGFCHLRRSDSLGPRSRSMRDLDALKQEQDKSTSSAHRAMSHSSLKSLSAYEPGGRRASSPVTASAPRRNVSFDGGANSHLIMYQDQLTPNSKHALW